MTNTEVPTRLVAGVTKGWRRWRVVDAATGEDILGVREVDTVAGTIVRSKIDDDGNLVRDGNAFATVNEQRRVRLDQIGATVSEPTPPADAPATPAEPAHNEVPD